MALNEEFDNPIQREHMHAFCTPHDDTYDYIERENESCEVGLADRPLQSVSFPRGGTEEDVREQIEGLRQAFSDADDENDWEEYGPSNDAVKQLIADREKFLTATDEEIFVVFHEDCQECDVVQKPLPGDRTWPEGWGQFTDEWNVLGNWCDDPAFKEVWDRRKVNLTEAIKRVAQMKVMPAPVPQPFAIDQKYKQAIDDLLPHLAPYSEDTDPYNVVVAQKKLRNQLAQHYAVLASKKLMLLIGGNKPPFASIGGEEGNYYLAIQQCQYDNWNGWHDFFKRHCQIAEWRDVSPYGAYDTFPVATWDLSGDPDFAQAQQKVYQIKLLFYDSHASGF